MLYEIFVEKRNYCVDRVSSVCDDVYSHKITDKKNNTRATLTDLTSDCRNWKYELLHKFLSLSGELSGKTN